MFCQFLSNHFELENGFKKTPKLRRPFLSAFLFTCFCMTNSKKLLFYFFIFLRKQASGIFFGRAKGTCFKYVRRDVATSFELITEED